MRAVGPAGRRTPGLSKLSGLTGFSVSPLYAVLHESIYAQSGTGPTAWAAEAVRDAQAVFHLAAQVAADPRCPPWLPALLGRAAALD